MIHENTVIADALKLYPELKETLRDVGLAKAADSASIDTASDADLATTSETPSTATATTTTVAAGETFGEALGRQNIDVESCLVLLNRKIWRDPSDVTYYIMKSFHYTESDLLDEIDPLLQTILKVHYETHGVELAKTYKVFLEAKAALKAHFARQEKVVFPEIEERTEIAASAENEERTEIGENANTHLAQEQEANRELAEILQRLAESTDQYTPPADGCATYHLTFEKLAALAKDAEAHLALENSRLLKETNL